MRTRNPTARRGAAQMLGRVSPLRAGSRGIDVRDATTESHPTTTIEFVGATVEDLDEGLARVTIGGAGGTPGSGGGSTASAPVDMLNNSGQDLLPGDVVVVDDTADEAVTVTTEAASILIAGVVQEPIAAGAIGPVLFNGYAPLVRTADDVTRGEYAQTSATAAAAAATASRVAGSFAVFLTGNDLANFITDSAVTETDVPDTSLEITMPTVIPAARFLLLALWLEDGATAVSIPGWTQIGAEEDFWYFYRISTGDTSDVATATWTGASVAVAAVLLAHDTVSLAVPIEDHDYDATTAAAAVSGLSDVARFAIASVRADVATPGSGFTLLAGGTAGAPLGGAHTIIQQTALSSDEVAGVSFSSPVTPGSRLVWVNWGRDTTETRVLLEGTSNPDTSWDYTQVVSHPDSGTDALGVGTKIATTSSQGPFHPMSSVLSSISNFILYEVANGGDATVLSATDQTGGTISIGSFTTTANDLILMAGLWKPSSDPTVSPGSFTEEVDAQIDTGGHPWMWLGRRAGSGGSVAASITTSATDRNWGAIAIQIADAAHDVAGTLAGKYIGHDAAVTSPFSGAGNELDAIFALNLMRDAMPSALLYGPDLSEGFPTEGLPPGAVLIWDGDSWEPGYPGAPLILEDGTVAVLEDGTAAIGEPTFI